MRSFVCTLTAALLIAGTTSVRADVDVQFSPATDFSTFRVYAWKAGTEARRADVQRRIAAAVERELAERGLSPTPEAPDLWVTTHTLVDKQSIAELSDESYFEFVTGVTSVDAYDLQAGTLVIDLVDAKSERIVWRAVASAKVDGPAEKMKKKVEKIVRKMFKRYPG